MLHVKKGFRVKEMDEFCLIKSNVKNEPYLEKTHLLHLGRKVMLRLNVLPLSADLLTTNRSSVFIGHHGQLALSSVFLDEYRDRLFLGGKDVLYSLMLGPISTEAKEVSCHNAENHNAIMNFIGFY